MSGRLLIVDDEPNVRLTYRAALELEGYSVAEANSAAAALEALMAENFDLAILDLRMPETDGLSLLAQMRSQGLATPAVFITAYGDLPNAVKAIKLGAIDFLQKPITPAQLRHVVEEIVERHENSEPSKVETRDYAYHLRSAKRAINLRDFDSARRSLRNALHLDDRSAEGFNLGGVVAELSGDFKIAARYYEQALRINANFAPAKQNARRIDELAKRGKSNEPFALGREEIGNIR
ncbi:MAG: response regulator [Chthoniobacterales bacterium]|nr:response regulator [Chthoniobacterales bacterium]